VDIYYLTIKNPNNMDLLVNSFAPLPELTSATDSINNLSKWLAPHKKALTAKQRIAIRSVGNSRMGLVKIVEKMAIQYDGKLSKEDNAAELSKRIAYLEKIRQYKIAAMNLFELLDDTDKALGQDVMAHVDKFSANLQTARQHDGDLDMAMKELDDYNARFGPTMDQEEAENTKPDNGNQPETPTTQA
jgi:hypothetical protein